MDGSACRRGPVSLHLWANSYIWGRWGEQGFIKSQPFPIHGVEQSGTSPAFFNFRRQAFAVTSRQMKSGDPNWDPSRGPNRCFALPQRERNPQHQNHCPPPPLPPSLGAVSVVGPSVTGTQADRFLSVCLGSLRPPHPPPPHPNPGELLSVFGLGRDS